MKKIMLLMFLIFGSLQLAKSQAPGGPCQSCDCDGVFASCNSGQCCPPYTAVCDCGWFSCKCKCGYRGGGIIAGPPHADVINEFYDYLIKGEFNSNESNIIKSKFKPMLVAYHGSDLVLYTKIAEEINATGLLLPDLEKRNINTWIQNKGGKQLIP